MFGRKKYKELYTEGAFLDERKAHQFSKEALKLIRVERKDDGIKFRTKVFGAKKGQKTFYFVRMYENTGFKEKIKRVFR